MKRGFYASLLTMVIGLSLTACGGNSSTPASGSAETASASGEEKTVELRMASAVAASELEARNTGMSAGLMTWIDTVESESGGTITIKVFPDSQLASGTDAIVNGIQTGAFEVAHFTTGNWSEYTDAFAELNMPFLYSNYDQVHSILEGKIGEAMKAKLEKDVSGIKALSYLSIGFRNITSSKPIHTVEDMNGLKIRTMNDNLQIAAMESMGAAVTSVPISELYSALQTKMVDAEENPYSTIYSNKFYEVNPYACETRHSFTSTFIFMNSDVYNSLSERQKAAIDKANTAATAASKEAAIAAEDEFRTQLSDAGMTIYQPSEEEMQGFKDAASSCWDQAREIMGEERYSALMNAMGL